MIGVAIAGGPAVALTTHERLTAAVPTALAVPAASAITPSRRPDMAITAHPTVREVVVLGRAARDATGIRLRLETGDGTKIAQAPLDPTGYGHGGWVPFETRFVVDAATTAGALPMFIAVVDATGRAVRTQRQPIGGAGAYLVIGADGRASFVTQGPLWAQARRTDPSERRSIGNDGLMGGIVFGVPMAERGG